MAEAMQVRAADLDANGAVWTYRPRRHKNQHRGLERVIFVGPRAQEVLLPFLRVSCPRCGLSDLPRRLAWRGDGDLSGPCGDTG
jgi:hypothetical protein